VGVRKRRIKLLKLKDYRFRDLVSCPPDCSALDAAVKMDEKHVGSILVDSKETGILGIVSRRDLVHSIIVRQKDPKKTKVTEVMHLSPISINDDASPLEALKKMIDRKVQCLVVRSSDDKIVGVISFGDVIGTVGSTALQNVSPEKASQVFDMVRRLTPLIISRYDGEERLEMERDLNNEAKALIRLLEEAEIALRH
jgi:signal-transduction protein with cAMP-binding, CBS, and nucleotidyltransferase domain